MQAKARDRLFWILLGLELAVFLGWQFAHLDGFQWGSDEGTYLMRVRLMDQGYRLYRDIWTDQLPGLIELLRLVLALTGFSVFSARGMIVVLTAGGLWGIALLARRLHGRVAGLGVIPLLSIAPNFYWLSRAIISPDLPSTAIGVMGLAALALYLETRHGRWRALAGVLFALALYVKATAILVAIPAACWLALETRARSQSLRRMWKELIIWGAWIAIPLVVALALHGPASLWQQFVVTQIASGRMPLKIGPHAAKIVAYLRENNWGLTALACVGLGISWWKYRRVALLGSIWLAVALFVLLVRSPMWPSHHLVVLLFPLALMAAVAVAEAWRVATTSVRSWEAIPLLGALVLYAGSLPGIWRADAGLARAPTYQSALEGVAFLQERFPDGAVVVSDYHMIPVRAGCTVPPHLATLTKKRLQLGLLKPQTLQEISMRPEVQAILFWDEQLSRLPEYYRWVQRHWVLAFKWGYHEIYVRPELSFRTRQEAILGDAIRLVGYRIGSPVVDPGQGTTLTLVWRAERPLMGDLTGFVHLVDAAGNRLAQDDHVLGGQANPAVDWMPGVLVEDRYRLSLDEKAPPGPVFVSIGVYDDDKKRWSARDALGNALPGDQVTLSERLVVRWPPNYVAPRMRQTTHVRVGELAELAGYSITREEGGSRLVLELVWHCLEPDTETSYVVFAQLRDGSEILAQHDAVPDNGQKPTIAWRSGEYVLDVHVLDLAPLARMRSAALYVGMYDPSTGQRLPVFEEGNPLDNSEIPLILPNMGEGL